MNVELPIVLVGLPGAGKSRVAAELHKVLSVPVVDMDEMIEKKTGTTISHIFAEKGEAEFRRIEAETVREIVQDAQLNPAIISLGGGAIETPQVRETIAVTCVIHIDASDEVLLSRIRRNNRRPLMKDDPENTLMMLRRRRDPLHAQVRDLKVVSTHGPVSEVVEQIMEGLNLCK